MRDRETEGEKEGEREGGRERDPTLPTAQLGTAVNLQGLCSPWVLIWLWPYDTQGLECQREKGNNCCTAVGPVLTLSYK